MSEKVKREDVYAPSDEVVARDIEGELIIVPLTAGVGDMEDELFTLNDSGRAIWKKLDGKKSVDKLISELSEEYRAEPGEIEKDVIGLLEELLKRNILSKK